MVGALLLPEKGCWPSSSSASMQPAMRKTRNLWETHGWDPQGLRQVLYHSNQIDVQMRKWSRFLILRTRVFSVCHLHHAKLWDSGGAYCEDDGNISYLHPPADHTSTSGP